MRGRGEQRRRRGFRKAKKEQLTPHPIINPPIVGLSSSTSANPTPPCASPTPDRISSWIRGDTTLHEGHHEVVHRVMRGVREEAERRVRVSNSDSWRTLWGVFWLIFFFLLKF